VKINGACNSLIVQILKAVRGDTQSQRCQLDGIRRVA
jgi:hypothetical protein